MTKMGVMEKPKKRGGAVPQMNGLKNSKFMMGISIFGDCFSLNDQGECNIHKGSGKFKIWKGMFSPIYLKYLVQHTWGLTNSYLFEPGEENEKCFIYFECRY